MGKFETNFSSRISLQTIHQNSIEIRLDLTQPNLTKLGNLTSIILSIFFTSLETKTKLGKFKKYRNFAKQYFHWQFVWTEFYRVIIIRSNNNN